MKSGANVIENAVLTNDVLAQLDAETITKITNALKALKPKSPKTRLNELLLSLKGFLDVSRRTDSDDVRFGDGAFKVDSWHKTAGEQWGNCAGSEIDIQETGTKYLSLRRYSYCTNHNSYSKYLRVEIADFLPVLEAYLPVLDTEKGPDRDQIAENFVSSVFKFWNSNAN